MDFLEYMSVQHKVVLNPQQKQAVLTIDGATLLLAVPGSGKTTVIITRLGNMIFNHQIPPEHILNISFSRASARDMKSRFIRLFGPRPSINQNKVCSLLTTLQRVKPKILIFVVTTTKICLNVTLSLHLSI